MKIKAPPRRRPVRAAKHKLRLYIAGESVKSQKALNNLKTMCDRDFPGEYQIEIIDVSKNPATAQKNNLIALPAVIRTLPAPIRQFIGTFSSENTSLIFVDLTAET